MGIYLYTGIDCYKVGNTLCFFLYILPVNMENVDWLIEMYLELKLELEMQQRCWFIDNEVLIVLQKLVIY